MPDPVVPAPEPQTTQAPEPQTTQPPAPATTPPPEPSTTPPPVAVEAAPKPEPKPEDWRDKRIAQLTAKLKDAQAKPKPEDKPKPEGGESEAEINARAEQLAAQRVALDSFNKACAEAAEKGRAEFPDFQSRVNELSRLVDRNDPASVGAYNEFIVAALETGEAPKIIHALGGDLNEAARILSLPPIKRAVELTRLAAKTPAEISKTPKPITPVGSKGPAHTAIDPTDPERADGLSIDAWMARRNEQIKARAAKH